MFDDVFFCIFIFPSPCHCHPHLPQFVPPSLGPAWPPRCGSPRYASSWHHRKSWRTSTESLVKVWGCLNPKIQNQRYNMQNMHIYIYNIYIYIHIYIFKGKCKSSNYCSPRSAPFSDGSKRSGYFQEASEEWWGLKVMINHQHRKTGRAKNGGKQSQASTT